MSRIFISAGDYSADIHGENLVRELRKIDPSLQVTALGGVKLQKVADRFLKDMVDLDVSGFSQPIKQFFNLKEILQKMVFPLINRENTDAVILIDYYGFNIHIAAEARKNNVPVFYFVSPQVWASRRWRVQRLKKFVTKMLVIFPFEETLYKEAQVPVEFVGHPLMEQILSAPQWKMNETTSANRPIRIGLMPGSRVRELTRHIPILLQTCTRLKKRFPNLEATLFAVEAIRDEVYDELIQSSFQKDSADMFIPKIVRNPDYRIRTEQTLCLTASGTATLENALLGIPMVVIYQTSWLTYWVAKQIIQVPFISMANILSGKKVVEELIQSAAEPETISRLLTSYLENPELLESMHRELIELRRKLGPPGAYGRAAQSILAHISKKS